MDTGELSISHTSSTSRISTSTIVDKTLKMRNSPATATQPYLEREDTISAGEESRSDEDDCGLSTSMPTTASEAKHPTKKEDPNSIVGRKEDLDQVNATVVKKVAFTLVKEEEMEDLAAGGDINLVATSHFFVEKNKYHATPVNEGLPLKKRKLEKNLNLVSASAGMKENISVGPTLGHVNSAAVSKSTTTNPASQVADRSSSQPNQINRSPLDRQAGVAAAFTLWDDTEDDFGILTGHTIGQKKDCLAVSDSHPTTTTNQKSKTFAPVEHLLSHENGMNDSDITPPVIVSPKTYPVLTGVAASSLVVASHSPHQVRSRGDRRGIGGRKKGSRVWSQDETILLLDAVDELLVSATQRRSERKQEALDWEKVSSICNGHDTTFTRSAASCQQKFEYLTTPKGALSSKTPSLVQRALCLKAALKLHRFTLFRKVNKRCQAVSHDRQRAKLLHSTPKPPPQQLSVTMREKVQAHGKDATGNREANDTSISTAPLDVASLSGGTDAARPVAVEHKHDSREKPNTAEDEKALSLKMQVVVLQSRLESIESKLKPGAGETRAANGNPMSTEGNSVSGTNRHTVRPAPDEHHNNGTMDETLKEATTAEEEPNDYPSLETRVFTLEARLETIESKLDTAMDLFRCSLQSWTRI